MIVDTSAIMAIVLDEPERAAFTRALMSATAPTMSAANWVELAAVMNRRRNAPASQDADRIIEAAGITIAPVRLSQAAIASTAYREFGRGAGHPADLNFGDCFAYALAKESGLPLLFKGDDFVHTDVLQAIDVQ